jgi:hypothetical protein
VVYFYNPNTQEDEAGGSQVQNQPGLQSMTPSQNNKQEKIFKDGGYSSKVEHLPRDTGFHTMLKKLILQKV